MAISDAIKALSDRWSGVQRIVVLCGAVLSYLNYLYLVLSNLIGFFTLWLVNNIHN